MSLRGCGAVLDDLVQVYSEDVVVEQLKQVYREQIRQAAGEIGDLLPHYRARVDAPTYELERAQVRLIQAWEDEGSMDARALEASLKYLLKKQRVFAALSHPGVEA